LVNQGKIESKLVFQCPFSAFDAGSKTKAYEEIADFCSYEPGHPTSPEQAQAELTMEIYYE
jgi:hypothetical protein